MVKAHIYPAHIYVEGGGNSKEGKTRCREGFRKLLEKCGFAGRMPRLTACGGRNEAYDDFITAHGVPSRADYVALLVDSEDPVPDISNPWAHLAEQDRWAKPDNASDDQALLMATCMETWIVADHNALSAHFGQNLQTSALPPLYNLESLPRGSIQDRLGHATRDCRPPLYERAEVIRAIGPTQSRHHRTLPT